MSSHEPRDPAGADSPPGPPDPSATQAEPGWQMPAHGTDPMPRRIGPYLVEDEIGRGGMGIVYRARDPRLERVVAIKMLPPAVSLDPGRQSRFIREAKLLALVNHPNVAAIYGIDETAEGRTYLALEYVEGSSLDKLLEPGPLALRQALAIASQIARGVEAAHERAVIHRDLKPANVRVTPEGLVKVLDFGLAKALGEPEPAVDGELPAPAARPAGWDLTELGALLGTAAYMSPEQVAGRAVDARADVWAFGCILFECLAGRKVWDQPTNVERLQAISSSPPEWSGLPEDTPDRIRRLLERCLEKEARFRLPGIDEARRDIEATLEALDEVRPAAEPRLRTPGNLPRHLTSFIGRETEIRTLREMASTTSLVTLTGPGGCGKTRLALEVARALQPEMPHGVWLVDLAPLGDAEHVPGAVAAALGVREEGERPLAASIEAFLRDRKLLLLLDNCEHVLASVAGLVDALLQTAADLHILATSREPLQVPDERVFPLRPLSVPHPGRIAPLADLERCEAVRLFAARAREVAPDFVLDGENAAAVVAVCHQLDGLPLAIELAAARTRALSVEQIQERLSDRFALLTAPGRRAPGRHRTLRALIDWSHDQLEETERRVLRRLGVFAGGLTLEAAEAVCAGEAVESAEVLDTLSALLDRSLIGIEKRGRELRYRLLETMREYARGRLAEAGEVEGASARLVAYYLRVVRAAAPHLRGADVVHWLDRLEEDSDNLRQALRLAGAYPGLAASGLRMAVALEPLWLMRGRIAEGRKHLEMLLGVEAEVPGVVREEALNAAGRLACYHDDPQVSRALHEEAMALAQHLGSREGRSRSLNGLAVVMTRLGDFATARALLDERLPLCQELGDRTGSAATWNNLGTVALHQGRNEDAVACLRTSLAVYRELSDKPHVAQTLANLAVVHTGTGRLAEAREALLESQRLREELRDGRGLVRTLVNRANVEMRARDGAAATALLERALEVGRDQEDRQATATILNNLTVIHLLAGRLTEARGPVREAVRMAWDMGDAALLVNVLENCARVEVGLGHAAHAARLTGAALRHRETLQLARQGTDTEEHAQAMEAMRAELGAEALAKELDVGAALTLDEAVELAERGPPPAEGEP